LKTMVIVYWSGTGNTKEMAEALAAGAASTEVQVSLLSVDKASPEEVLQADGIALGCPAMGGEVLEELEMEPFVSELEQGVANKPMILFGSYDWGNGQWMRDWTERMQKGGACLLDEGLIQQGALDATSEEACKQKGAKFAVSLINC
jgi:flavodoxin short chain